MITDSQIKAALRKAPTIGRIELRDGGERGAGRLALLVRSMTNRITAEWYAVYYRNGKRVMCKIGTYPTMSIADARKHFREAYAPAISAGEEPESRHGRRRHGRVPKDASVKALFESYVESLESAGKRSAPMAKRLLLANKTGAAAVIGARQPAAAVTPAHIISYLAKIHERGAIVMARQARSYVSAAFTFGLKAAHDYTSGSAGSSWGIKHNPVAAIPADKKAFRTGQRFLSPAELHAFWLWLESDATTSDLAPAWRLLLATGQRVEEILKISSAMYEKEKKMLCWSHTKTGNPHAIPLPQQAADILDHMTPNEHGLYFPHQFDPKRPATCRGLRWAIVRFRKAHPSIPHFTPRDSRRTWKTLAGDAGLSKDMRDRLQNHTKKNDTSSRHYDRYDYLPERRAAMAKWAAYMDLVLAGKITAIGQRDSNVVPIDQAA